MLNKKNLFDGLGLDHDYHCLEHQDLGLIGKKHKHWRKAHKGDDINRVQYKCEGRHCIVCNPVEATENSMPDKSFRMRMVGLGGVQKKHSSGDQKVAATFVANTAQMGGIRGAGGRDERPRWEGSEAQVGRIKPADLSGPS